MKKNIFKLTTLILLISSTVVLGFGCKGLSTTQQAATAPVTLEYWTVYDDVGAIKNLLAKYTANRSFIKINVRQYSPNEFYDRLIEALAEDKGPDIISVSNKDLGKYLTKLSSMPSSIQDTTLQVSTSNLQEQTIVNTVSVNLPTTRDIETDYVQTVSKDAVRGGKIYGLPLSLDTMAIYYNKDLLDRAGVAQPPTSWEEFQDAAKKTTKITKKDNVEQITQSGAALGVGQNVPGSDDLLYILMQQSGGNMVNDNGAAVFNLGKNTLEGPSGKTLTFFTDFANPERDTYSWNKDMGNALDKFAQGSLAFFFGYSFNYDQIKARGPQINFSVIPMLQLNPEKPVNVANYYLQTVSEKSKHQNEAWGVINFLARTANKDYLATSRRPTALRSYILEQKKDETLAPFVSQVLIADTWYRGRNYALAQQSLYDLLTAWLTVPVGDKSLSEFRQNALDRAASRINQSL